MNKIDILCYYDNLHKPLFDIFFLPSFKKYLTTHFNLIENTFYTDPNTESKWNSEHWSKILLHRLDLIKIYILNNKNKWAIFSDIDILFFGNFYQDIEIYINNNLHDIYYMPEFIKALINQINGGFFLFYCNDNTYNLIDEIQKYAIKMEMPNDQIAASYILKQSNIAKQSLLGRHVFLTNNNPRKKICTLIKNGTAKVFHSTSTSNLMEKFQVLSSVYLAATGTEGYNVWMPTDY